MQPHKCIKCQADYQDNDVEAYLCVSCNEERLRIAAEIDKKMVGKISEREATGFTQLEKMAKSIPSQSGGMATFFRASDLGL